MPNRNPKKTAVIAPFALIRLPEDSQQEHSGKRRGEEGVERLDVDEEIAADSADEAAKDDGDGKNDDRGDDAHLDEAFVIG